MHGGGAWRSIPLDGFGHLLWPTHTRRRIEARDVVSAEHNGQESGRLLARGEPTAVLRRTGAIDHSIQLSYWHAATFKVLTHRNLRARIVLERKLLIHFAGGPGSMARVPSFAPNSLGRNVA